jgi:hypothetical protein
VIEHLPHDLPPYLRNDVAPRIHAKVRVYRNRNTGRWCWTHPCAREIRTTTGGWLCSSWRDAYGSGLAHARRCA